MRRLGILVIGLALSLGLGYPVRAQQPKTLLDFRKELGLSEATVKKVTTVLSNFQAQSAQLNQALNQLENDYAVLTDTHADLGPMKAKLLQIAQIRWQLRTLDLVAARQVQDSLTPAQLKKWLSMQTTTPGKKP